MRHIEGYWYVWVQGMEWPSWFYGEGQARSAAKTFAKQNPGKDVYLGTTNTKTRIRMPMNFEVEDYDRPRDRGPDQPAPE